MKESKIKPTERNLPLQKRAREKYEQILEVACHMLVEGGYAKLSTREIARRADCNIATIYRYFGGVNDIIKALGEPFLSGISQLLDLMLGMAYRGESLESIFRFFLFQLTKEIDDNRWLLHAEAATLIDKDLIAWDIQLMNKIEVKLSSVLSAALPSKDFWEIEILAFRLVRHWKSYLRCLIEFESLEKTTWLTVDTVHTSIALVSTPIQSNQDLLSME